MTIGEEILKESGKLFEVAGATILADGLFLLILGLESNIERNLDLFGEKTGRFMLYGFQKHVAPRLSLLVNYIHKLGYDAEPVKRYGYPLRGEINLKNEAIRAGLGKRGKNTVVLHTIYGPRLRFTAIWTKAPLEFATTSEFVETENPICQNCHICLDVCPTRVLAPYRMLDPLHCLSNITTHDANGYSILCDKCLTQCPTGISRK